MMVTSDLNYLPARMSPERCLHCEEPFARPVTWRFIPYDGVVVRTHCGACGKHYRVVISDEQAELWDEHLERQQDQMVRGLEWLVKAPGLRWNGGA
jgi:RNase P subunit RPR2